MPAGQVTTNCHYITRSLTTPWEGDQRKLRFFDFDDNRFKIGQSATLFAADEINTQEVETWLDRTVENPLGACRRRLAAGDPNALDDWRFFRAATLMLWLQGVRVKAVADDDARRQLRELAGRPTDDIDGLVRAIAESYDLQLVTTVGDGERLAPVFVPSSGLFKFTYPDAGCASGNAVGLALPIDMHCALLATPAEKHGTRDLSRAPGSLSNCSVGTSAARRVVIPPTVFSAYSEDELRTILLELRQANDFLVSAVHDAQELVVGAYAEAGLEVGRDGAGRVTPKVP
jgi:hypothetical protein